MSEKNLDSLQSTFQFKKPILTGVFFLPNDHYKGDSKNISLQFNTRLLSVASTDDSSDKYKTGKVELEVTNFRNNNEDAINESPYLLSIKMQADFKWPSNWKNETVKKFVKVNAASLLFSYIRPVISDITGMSAYEREDLPFVDFSKAIDKK